MRPDGTLFGAGWFGQGTKRVHGEALFAGDSFVRVEVYSCTNGPCEGIFDDELSAWLSPAT